jgi:hypothetical protein
VQQTSLLVEAAGEVGICGDEGGVSEEDPPGGPPVDQLVDDGVTSGRPYGVEGVLVGGGPLHMVRPAEIVRPTVRVCRPARLAWQVGIRAGERDGQIWDRSDEDGRR